MAICEPQQCKRLSLTSRVITYGWEGNLELTSSFTREKNTNGVMTTKKEQQRVGLVQIEED